MAAPNNRYANLEGGGPVSRTLATTRGAVLAGTALGLDVNGNFPVATVAPGGLTTSLIGAGVHLLGLPNGNFEDAVGTPGSAGSYAQGWTPVVTGTGTTILDTTAANKLTGANSVKMVLAAAADTVTYTGGPFPCGAGIPLSVYVRAKSSAQAARLTVVVYWLATPTSAASSATTVVQFTGLSTAFNEYGSTVIPPAGTCYGIVAWTVDTAADTVWLDECVSIREGTFDFDLRRFGAYGDGATDDTNALARSLNFLSRAGGGTLCIRQPHYLNPSATSSLTIPTNVELRFGPLGRFKLGSKMTLVVNGRINAGTSQVFDTSGGGAISTSAPNLNPIVFPEWWGAKPGQANTQNADSAPAINSAARFVEIYGGTVKFSSGSYTCLTGLSMQQQSVWSGSNQTFPNAAVNQTTLDFTYAPAGTTGISVNNGTQINMPIVEKLLIFNSVAKAGDGSFGLTLAGCYRGKFDDLSINGFDQSLILTATTNYSNFENTFRNAYILNYKTRAIYAVSQSTTMFYNCDIIGAATAEVIYIAAPASSGGGVTQDTFTLDFCRVGNNQSAYPQILVRIIGGFWHTFTRTDFETALTAAIQIQVANTNDTTDNVIVDNCWFDDSGVAINSTSNLPSIKVVNCARMLANAAGSTTSGGVTTSTPGANACIAINIAAGSTGIGLPNILIQGCDMFAYRSDAQAIFINNVASARVIGNRIRQLGSAEGNSGINLYTYTANNIVMGNLIHSTNTNPVADNGTGNHNINTFAI